MIYVNYKPVVVTQGLESCIVLTDKAMAEPSVVYMDKADIPPSDKPAWVQILNRHYNPDDEDNDRDVDGVYLPQTYDEDDNPEERQLVQDHEGNPYWIMEAWFWVDSLFTSEIPGNSPLPEYTSEEWLKRPGIVKVVMYEHKFALTKQASLDHVNIMSRMYWCLGNINYNLLDKEKFFNHMDWNEIAAFLTPDELGVTIDYADDNKDEYPPVFPIHCQWRHRLLSECLDDLLKNFDSRIISTTAVKPEKEVWDTDENWDSYFQPESEPVTLLKWLKRKKIELNKDVDYQKLEWPIHREQEELDEENSEIWYATVNINFGGSTRLYAPHIASNREYRSDVDFICNLYPHSNTYELGGFEALSAYLRLNRVNVKTYYQFLTRYLPPSFQEDTDWSTIKYIATPSDLQILVNHLPRKSYFPTTSYVGALNVKFTGKVKSVQGSELVMYYLLDTTNGVTFPDDTAIRPNQVFGVKPNDIIHGHIDGETMVITSVVTDPDPDDIELIPVMYNGERVDTIIWEIDSWNPSITDDMLAFDLADPGNLLNYTLTGYTVEDTFERIEYPVSSHEGYKNNISNPYTENTMTLTFQMKNGMEEVKQHYYDVFQGRYELESAAIASIAETHLRFYHTLSFQIGLSHDVRTLTPYMNDIHTTKTHLRSGDNPELFPADYYINYTAGFSAEFAPEYASNFPYTFPAKILPVDGDEYQYFQSNGLPVNIMAVKMYLFQRYHAWIRSHTATVSLETTPVPPPIPEA